MIARARRGVTVVGLGACLVTTVALTACGGGTEPVEAGAGSEPVASTAPATPETSAPAPLPTPSTEAEVADEPAPADGASVVDGLSAAELRTVVEAPAPTPSGRRRSAPVADQVSVGGRTVWRITIPGTFELLSSRIVVAVGGRDVGHGVVAPDLATLVTVATDPTVLTQGAAVTYRWGASAPVEAGALEVVR